MPERPPVRCQPSPRRASSLPRARRRTHHLDVPHMRSDCVRAAAQHALHNTRRASDGASFHAANLSHLDPHAVPICVGSRRTQPAGTHPHTSDGSGRPLADGQGIQPSAALLQGRAGGANRPRCRTCTARASSTESNTALASADTHAAPGRFGAPSSAASSSATSTRHTLDVSRYNT